MRNRRHEPRFASCKNTLRVLAGAIETYHADSGHYPPASGVGEHHNAFGPFASPVSLRPDPAYDSGLVPHPRARRGIPDVRHRSADRESIPTTRMTIWMRNQKPSVGAGITSGGEWRVAGVGPDLFLCVGGVLASDGNASARGVDYDATNGTNSIGDIVRVGALCTRYGDPSDLQNPSRPGILRVPFYRETVPIGAQSAHAGRLHVLEASLVVESIPLPPLGCAALRLRSGFLIRCCGQRCWLVARGGRSGGRRVVL